MSRYERLARQAWRSGEYRAEDASGGGTLREDGEAQRARLRAKMEWIVEREGWRPGASAGSGLRLAPHARWRAEGAEGLLYDTRAERVWRVSGAGAAVLGALESCADEASLLAGLRGRFRDESGALERDARAFLSDLRARGLLEG